MKNAPECRECQNSTIEVEAGVLTSIKYWYCRNCKEEIDNSGFIVKPQKQPGPTEELDSYLEEQIAEMEAEGGPGQGLTPSYYDDFSDDDDGYFF